MKLRRATREARSRRLALLLAGAVAAGLVALAGAQASTGSAQAAGGDPVSGSASLNLQSVFAHLPGPEFWSPISGHDEPSLSLFKQEAPSVLSPGYLAQDPLSGPALKQNVNVFSALPNHLTGTPNEALQLYLWERELEADGMDLGQVSYSFTQNVPTRVSLTVGKTKEPATAISPIQYSGSTGAAGVSGRLFYGGNGTGDLSASTGKIVVLYSGNEFGGLGSKEEGAGVRAAAAAGAKAVITINPPVEDFPDFADEGPAGGDAYTIPTIRVGRVTGASVLKAAETGENAKLVLQSTEGTGCASLVWGELPGKDPSRRIFIGAPSSSLTPSAGERGSVDAVLLGLAHHYAELPISERPATLVFLFIPGHEVEGNGLFALANAKGSWFTGAEAYVFLGSMFGQPSYASGPNGEILTDPSKPFGTVRYSQNPVIESIFPSAFSAAGLTPPAKAGPGGEQGDVYALGIPTVGMNGDGGLHPYYHTIGDRPGVIDETILSRQAQAFRNVIDGLAAQPAGAVKAANGAAEALAGGSEPGPPVVPACTG